MIKIKNNFVYISLLLISCEIGEPLIHHNLIESEIFVDYNQDSNQIFTSVSLDNYDGIIDSSINMNLNWFENFDDIIACIDNYSLSSNEGLSVVTKNSNCIYMGSINKGCKNPNALNFDPFAVEDDGTCLLSGNEEWNQIKLGEFDYNSYSFPVYMLSNNIITYFEFDIKGIQIDSLEELIPNIIDNYDGNIVKSGIGIFSGLDEGLHQLCRIYVPKPPISIKIDLYDNGENGDIIANNKIYHSIFNPTNLLFGEYQVEIEFNNDESIYQLIDNANLIYNFHPKIVSVEMPEFFMLDNFLWTDFEFFVTVFDANKGNDIDHIQPLINIVGFNSVDTAFVTEDIFNADPSHRMEYHNWIEKKTYRYRTVIPMKPAQSDNLDEVGKWGEAIFRFNVYDKQNYSNSYDNQIEFERILSVLKCGDGICSEEYENEITCIEDCIE